MRPLLWSSPFRLDLPASEIENAKAPPDGGRLVPLSKRPGLVFKQSAITAGPMMSNKIDWKT